MGRRKIDDYSKLNPPYLSYSYFSKSIDYFKTIELKENDRLLWDVFDYSSVIKQRLCLAYKFLNFITPNDDITSTFLTFLFGPEEEKQKIILSAYDKFFKEVPDIISMQKAELKEKFKNIYDLKESSLNINFSFFLGLLKHYGFFDTTQQKILMVEHSNSERFMISQLAFKLASDQQEFFEKCKDVPINATCKYIDGSLYVLLVR